MRRWQLWLGALVELATDGQLLALAMLPELVTLRGRGSYVRPSAMKLNMVGVGLAQFDCVGVGL